MIAFSNKNVATDSQARRLIAYLLRIAIVLLLITAIAKLVSGFGSTRVLEAPDPLFGLSFRYLFWIVGVIELVVCLACIFAKTPLFKASILAWFSTCLLIYRLGLLWIGYRGPCHCLGNLTDAIGVSPKVAETCMEIVLGYLTTVSYAAVLWIKLQISRSFVSQQVA